MYQFDLDKAIVAWRHSLLRNRTFLDEDLDELEEHLRDHVQSAIEEGMDAESAYRKAQQRLGDHHELESSFRTVRFGRSKRRRHAAICLVFSATMLHNYLRVALRSFLRQKGYTFINIGGLAIGIACCLLIGAYVVDELSWDRFHDRSDDIFRVHLVTGSGERANIQGPIGPVLERELADVEKSLRLFRHWSSPLIASETMSAVEDMFYFADSTFFDVFSFELIRGDARSALAAPMSVVLSETAARRYFGEADPIGRTLTYDGSSQLTVTGIMADPPRVSHIHPEFVASMSTLPRVSYAGILDEWWVFYTYLVLSGADTSPGVESAGARVVAAALGFESDPQFRLVPVTDIHLGSNLSDELEVNGDIRYVRLFSAIGLLILVIACINYMNLATARSGVRAREIGVRKASGAGRSQIAGQFLSESILMVAIAWVLAVCLVYLVDPALVSVTGRNLAKILWSSGLLSLSFFLVLFVGLVAGGYPAFLMSAMKTSQILKGDSGVHGGSLVRKTLVAGQFAASAVLIVGTLIVLRQLNFVSEMKLGFNAEHVVAVDVQTDEVASSYPALREAWLSLSAVQGVGSSASSYPGQPHAQGHGLRTETMEENINMQRNWVDDSYADALGIEVVAGRMFDSVHETERDVVVLNESAVQALGWRAPQDAIGRTVLLGDTELPLEVVGVVADYHFESLHTSIAPLILSPHPSTTVMLVRMEGEQLSTTLDRMGDVWKNFTSDPFVPVFLDDELEALYRADRVWGRLMAVASGLAIIIACLGLLGLAAFMTQRRTREIGVRKVLGATTVGIVSLLAKDFLKLVLIANLVAVPIAWWATDRWLDDFAYRTDVGVGVYLLGGVVLLAVAMATVSFQSIRAAVAPPVHSLRAD